jgi:hypothetical protein
MTRRLASSRASVAQCRTVFLSTTILSLSLAAVFTFPLFLSRFAPQFSFLLQYCSIALTLFDTSAHILTPSFRPLLSPLTIKMSNVAPATRSWSSNSAGPSTQQAGPSIGMGDVAVTGVEGIPHGAPGQQVDVKAATATPPRKKQALATTAPSTSTTVTASTATPKHPVTGPSAPTLSLPGPAQAAQPVAFTGPTMADWTKLQQDNALLQAALLALQHRDAQVAASQATTALQAAPAMSVTLVVGVTTIDPAMALPPPNLLLAILGGAVNSGPVVPAPVQVIPNFKSAAHNSEFHACLVSPFSCSCPPAPLLHKPLRSSHSCHFHCCTLVTFHPTA